MAGMGTLNGTARFANTDGLLLFETQSGALFIEKNVGDHDQSPEAKNGGSGHELVMVDTQDIFGVLKEDLNLPSSGDVLDQAHQVGLQIAGGPVTDGFGRAREAGADNDDLTAI